MFNLYHPDHLAEGHRRRLLEQAEQERRLRQFPSRPALRLTAVRWLAAALIAAGTWLDRHWGAQRARPEEWLWPPPVSAAPGQRERARAASGR
ncbi:MAG: hypothetical protein ACYC5O_06655 [Anaerolineae bacterium]